VSKVVFYVAITLGFIALAFSIYRIAADSAEALDYIYIAIFVGALSWARIQVVTKKRATRG
jgi:hypothetical protein